MAISRQLRRNETHTELLLWAVLRRRQLEGKKFRRQARISHYVVDFYCAEERLVVEVDGEIHKHQFREDAARAVILEELGLRILRVTAQQVEADLSQVTALIAEAFVAHAPSPLKRERGDPELGEGSG